MEIDKLEAGPELDRLVAEKVMGWKRDNRRADRWTPPGREQLLATGTYYTDRPGKYSTDIAAAWDVVEKLDLFRAVPDSDIDSGFCLQRERDGYWAVKYRYGIATARATTAPVAICRAALKAKGVK